MLQTVAAVDGYVGLKANLRPYFLEALANALRWKEGQPLQPTAVGVSSIDANSEQCGNAPAALLCPAICVIVHQGAAAVDGNFRL